MKAAGKASDEINLKPLGINAWLSVYAVAGASPRRSRARSRNTSLADAALRAQKTPVNRPGPRAVRAGRARAPRRTRAGGYQKEYFLTVKGGKHVSWGSKLPAGAADAVDEVRPLGGREPRNDDGGPPSGGPPSFRPTVWWNRGAARDRLLRMLRYELRGPAAWLTIDRPDKLNAMTRAFFGELRDALGRVDTDAGARCVVIEGAGRCFSVGGDIEGFGDLTGPADRRAYVREAITGFRAVEECTKPMIAAVHGHALGGGCELTLVCDLVVADTTARFGLPETAVGLLPGPGVVRGRSNLTLHALKHMIFTGAVLEAEDAMRVGLVNEVVPEGGHVARRPTGPTRSRPARRSRWRPPRRCSRPRAGSGSRTRSTRSRCSRGARTSPRASRRSSRSARPSSPADEHRARRADDGRARRRAGAAPGRGARDGRRGAGRAAPRERPADGPRAARPARRRGLVLRGRPARGRAVPPRRAGRGRRRRRRASPGSTGGRSACWRSTRR